MSEMGEMEEKREKIYIILMRGGNKKYYLILGIDECTVTEWVKFLPTPPPILHTFVYVGAKNNNLDI